MTLPFRKTERFTLEKLLNYFKNIDYDGYEFYKNEYISQYESDLEESYSL